MLRQIRNQPPERILRPNRLAHRGHLLHGVDASLGGVGGQLGDEEVEGVDGGEGLERVGEGTGEGEGGAGAGCEGAGDCGVEGGGFVWHGWRWLALVVVVEGGVGGGGCCGVGLGRRCQMVVDCELPVY